MSGMEEFEAKKYIATARATVVVEVIIGASWGGQCSVAQIAKQAADEARGKILNLFATKGIHMIGEPVVTAVFTKVAAS
jgi:hypothetical protein